MNMGRIALVATGLALALSACSKEPAKVKPEAAADAAGPAAEPASAPEAAPTRKAGLWEQTVSTMGMNQTTRMCIDAATSDKVSMWGSRAGPDNCSEHRTTKTAAGWSFHSVCAMPDGGTTTTDGAVTGDFGASYRLEATSTTAGASAPQMNGTHKMTMDAVWKGPCPPGFKPGDMEMPGGMKMNLADMAARMKAAK